MKAIEYRLRSTGQLIHLYIFLNNESRQLAVVKSAWDKIKFAFPDTVEQNASVELNLKNTIDEWLENEKTGFLVSLFEHYTLNFKASIWSQITEYGQRLVEGMVLSSRYRAYKYLITGLALLLNKTEIQLNGTTLTDFYEAIEAILVYFFGYEFFVEFRSRHLVEDIEYQYRKKAKKMPIANNILAFLKEYIDTELIQVFANFFKLSAKVTVEGKGILNLLPRIP